MRTFFIGVLGGAGAGFALSGEADFGGPGRGCPGLVGGMPGNPSMTTGGGAVSSGAPPSRMGVPKVAPLQGQGLHVS